MTVVYETWQELDHKKAAKLSRSSSSSSGVRSTSSSIRSCR